MPVRLNGVHDASHANKRSSYAYEGFIVRLQEDKVSKADVRGYLDSSGTLAWAGKGQLVAHSARKSKRISNSTSHGETLSAINGPQLVNLISLRYTEIFCISTFGRTPTTYTCNLKIWSSFLVT